MTTKARKAARYNISGLPSLAWGLVALVIVGLASAISYQMGVREGSRVVSDDAYKRAVISARVSALYRTSRDATMGAVTQTDLYTVYDNALTSELAATVKRDGAAAVFCSSKVPVDMTFDSPSMMGVKGTIQAHLNFSARPSTESAEKTVAVDFDVASTKITAITCL